MFKITVFALAVSGLCLGSAAWADDAEDKAVAFVEKLGGTVTRELKALRKDDKALRKPVIEVQLSNTKVTDAGLKELAPLKNLTTLDLGGTNVTDAGLKELAPLKNRFIQGFGGLSYSHLCECYPISENLVWWRVSSRCLRCS